VLGDTATSVPTYATVQTTNRVMLQLVGVKLPPVILVGMVHLATNVSV